ncbi:Tripartite ATP-independent periplasmic transporters, DctQ component [Marinomonas spartinae]|uniref:TRAP transporter small permease n=1 Tax=Marinomonas spartinae TaxID=1792290 RepID=UPI000808EA03|nr:TRAP transporter small permease [Marinomonas spartinae]SBS27020.1 Tripartite ATP-independent periplasmic transporters, DctQ component [Marinomonas spartinae]
MLIRFLATLSRQLNRLSGALAMLLIVYVLCHILLEIVLRLFGTSTYVLDEFVGYAVAAITFLGLGYSLERNSLIRVNILMDRLPERFHWLLDLLVSAMSFAIFTWISYYWYINTLRSFQRGTTSSSIAETPLWIPEGMVLIGLVLLCFTLLVRMLLLISTRHVPHIELAQSHE